MNRNGKLSLLNLVWSPNTKDWLCNFDKELTYYIEIYII